MFETFTFIQAVGEIRIFSCMITRIEASGPYSYIFTWPDTPHLVCVHLKELEKRLKHHKIFLKVSRSILVNALCIKRVRRMGHSLIIIPDDLSALQVPRRKEGLLIKRIKKLNPAVKFLHYEK
jgi:DNA-binding LytR/AlgR family response regulator